MSISSRVLKVASQRKANISVSTIKWTGSGRQLPFASPQTVNRLTASTVIILLEKLWRRIKSLKRHTIRKGDRKMKKRSLILITVLLFALLSSSVLTVSAHTDAPIECIIDLTFDPNAGNFWDGTVTGCSLQGSIRIWESDDNYVVGKTEHFFETFTIWPLSGGEINGVDAGVWNFSTFKFRANGWVTSASAEWEYLVGYKFHEMGRTSDPSVMPMTAPNTAMTLHSP
jgi:hypothetical protein